MASPFRIGTELLTFARSSCSSKRGRNLRGFSSAQKLTTVVVVKKSLLGAALFCPLSLVSLGWAQTFDLGGQPAPTAQKKQPGEKNKKSSASGDASSGQGSLGWGSSIEVGRNARAAEDAL